MHADVRTRVSGAAEAVKKAAVILIPSIARTRTSPSSPASKVAAIAEATKINVHTTHTTLHANPRLLNDLDQFPYNCVSSLLDFSKYNVDSQLFSENCC